MKQNGAAISQAAGGARQTTNSAGTQSKIKHQIPSNGRIKDASVIKLKEKKTNHDMN